MSQPTTHQYGTRSSTSTRERVRAKATSRRPIKQTRIEETQYDDDYPEETASKPIIRTRIEETPQPLSANPDPGLEETQLPQEETQFKMVMEETHFEMEETQLPIQSVLEDVTNVTSKTEIPNKKTIKQLEQTCFVAIPLSNDTKMKLPWKITVTNTCMTAKPEFGKIELQLKPKAYRSLNDDYLFIVDGTDTETESKEIVFHVKNENFRQHFVRLGGVASDNVPQRIGLPLAPCRSHDAKSNLQRSSSTLTSATSAHPNGEPKMPTQIDVSHHLSRSSVPPESRPRKQLDHLSQSPSLLPDTNERETTPLELSTAAFKELFHLLEKVAHNHMNPSEIVQWMLTGFQLHELRFVLLAALAGHIRKDFDFQLERCIKKIIGHFWNELSPNVDMPYFGLPTKYQAQDFWRNKTLHLNIRQSFPKDVPKWLLGAPMMLGKKHEFVNPFFLSKGLDYKKFVGDKFLDETIEYQQRLQENEEVCPPREYLLLNNVQDSTIASNPLFGEIGYGSGIFEGWPSPQNNIELWSMIWALTLQCAINSSPNVVAETYSDRAKRLAKKMSNEGVSDYEMIRFIDGGEILLYTFALLYDLLQIKRHQSTCLDGKAIQSFSVILLRLSGRVKELIDMKKSAPDFNNRENIYFSEGRFQDKYRESSTTSRKAKKRTVETPSQRDIRLKKRSRSDNRNSDSTFSCEYENQRSNQETYF